MSDNWLQLLITVAGYIFGAGGFITLFIEKKKNRAAANIASIDEVERLRDLYLKMVGDASASLQKVPELELKIKNQDEQILMLTDIIEKQRQACETCAVFSKKRKP